MKRALIATALAFVFPTAAQAGLVTMVSRDVPLGPRALQAAAAPMKFNMIAVHWRGTGAVEYRTRTLAGRWDSWRSADDDVGPDAGLSEARRAWRDGNLDWVGASRGVQFRTHGAVTRLRAFYLWSRVTTAPRRRLAVAGLPAIVPRSGWQADEQIRHTKPRYAAVLKLAIVHHTAGENTYPRAQAAAIVRGIEIYHVQGNGWADIGYNFLIDRFGTVYEGRAGGIDKNVIGAHAEGFNTGSVGVALLGMFLTATPPQVMQDALVNLLSWRLDVAHIDPLATFVDPSRGNLKFKAGTPVTLRTISGHRDTGPSECPGNGAYALLPTIAERVSQTALPKLYSPVVTGKLGTTIRFQGRLSSALPWTVTITNQTGTQVAQGKGTTATVDWSWNASAAGGGPYRWSIDAGPAVLPASGTLGVGKVPSAVVVKPVATAAALTSLTATPALITPSPDGTGGYATVNFVLAGAALVTVRVVSSAPESPPATLLSSRLEPGGHSFQWNFGSLADGAYSVVVTAQGDIGDPVSQSRSVTIDRTLSGLTALPGSISPNGDGVADTTTFGFALGQSAPVTLLVQRSGVTVATVYSGVLAAGPQAIAWNGMANGTPLPAGVYQVVVTASGPLGTLSLSLGLTIEATGLAAAATVTDP